MVPSAVHWYAALPLLSQTGPVRQAYHDGRGGRALSDPFVRLQIDPPAQGRAGQTRRDHGQSEPGTAFHCP